MAESINGTAAISSLLRAQLSAPLVGLKANQDATQALVDQLQKTAAPAKAGAVTLTSKAIGPDSNLPRGSIIDKLV